jgi:chorismate--pyruvate lyase
MSPAPAETAAVPERHWLDAAGLVRAGVPAPQRAWLEWSDLLTAALRRASGPGFRLTLLRERPVVLEPQERARMGGADGRAFAREIVMGDDSCAYVFARTLVPEQTLSAHPWLGSLGEASLGERLRQDGQPRREPFRFLLLDAADPWLGSLRVEARSPVWARHSVFRLAGGPLSVLEAFLPDIARCPAPRAE